MGSTYPSPAALATPLVGASSVQVAPPNPTRLALYVFNPSATVTLYVMPANTPAAVGNGMIIQPQQGVLFGPPSTGTPWTAGMNAIASSGGSNVIVILEFYQ